MMTRTLRTALALFLVLAAPLAFSACGATDSVKDIKEATDIAGEGLETGSYLQSVNAQQQEYSRVISSQTLTPPHDAAQAKKLEQAEKDLNRIAKELEGIKAEKQFARSHKNLIAAVKETAAAAGDLAAAAREGNDAAFMDATKAWGNASTKFGKAVEASTKGLQDAANDANDGPG